MTTRDCSLLLAPLLTLAGCASGSPKASDSSPIWQETVGTGTTTEHNSVKAANRQMFDTEHSVDTGASTESNTQNQGIP